MPTIEELEQSLPEKSEYRVVGVGVTYRDPQATIGPDGQPQIVYQYAVAGRGEVVSLTEHEARRLEATGTIKPVEADRSYDEMSDEELEAETSGRGLDVRGSAVDGAVRREDRINALVIYDEGATAGTSVGATTVPGGVALARPGSSDLAVQTGAGAPSPPAPDPLEADTNELAAYIKRGPTGRKLTAEQTIALAQGDPARAEKVLDAERQATEGDPRQSVEARLKALAEQGENDESTESGGGE